MITYSDYSEGGAGALVNYMQTDQGREITIRDHTGKALSRDELEQFVQHSKECGFERQFIVSPDPDLDVHHRAFDRRTRALMRQWRADKANVRYVYAVHDQRDKPHAHVAVTGPKRELYMDRDDLDAFRETATDVFRESERTSHRQRTAVAQRTLSASRSAAREYDRAAARDAHHE
jgi:hypothetical protein